MGTRFNEKRRCWEAWYQKRHPIKRAPRKLFRTNLKSKNEAMRVEKELIVQLEESFKEQTVPTWQNLLKEFFNAKSLSDWGPKTLEDGQFMLDAHTMSKWGKRRLDSISPNDIKELIFERLGHNSPSTQQTLLKFIRGAFNYAVECRLLNSNPCPKIKFKTGEKIKKVLTEEQVGKLLSQAKIYQSDWYYHWAMAVYTGMRNGELYALTWDKVNLEGRRILVDTSWSKKAGFKSTKSGDDRIVEIAPNLVQELKELKLKTESTGFVLPRSRNWDKGEQARMLRYFLEGISLPTVRFHDLRATWATIMLSKGIEPIKVMTMGGWKDLKTMQIYIRKAGVGIKGITDCLNLHSPGQQEATVIALSRS